MYGLTNGQFARATRSQPGAIDQGLAQFSVFALVWCEAASNSQCVRTEMDAAVTRWIRDRSLRLVPVVLDRTPLLR